MSLSFVAPPSATPTASLRPLSTPKELFDIGPFSNLPDPISFLSSLILGGGPDSSTTTPSTGSTQTSTGDLPTSGETTSLAPLSPTSSNDNSPLSSIPGTTTSVFLSTITSTPTISISVSTIVQILISTSTPSAADGEVTPIPTFVVVETVTATSTSDIVINEATNGVGNNPLMSGSAGSGGRGSIKSRVKLCAVLGMLALLLV